MTDEDRSSGMSIETLAAAARAFAGQPRERRRRGARRWISEAEARGRLERILDGAAARLTAEGHVVLVEVARSDSVRESA